MNFLPDFRCSFVEIETHIGRVVGNSFDVATFAIDPTTKMRCRGQTVEVDAGFLVDFDIRLSEMDCAIAEQDESGSNVGIERVQERELLETDDASGLRGTEGLG